MRLTKDYTKFKSTTLYMTFEKLNSCVIENPYPG